MKKLLDKIKMIFINIKYKKDLKKKEGVENGK